MFYVSPLTKVTFLLKKILSFGVRWWVGVHCVFEVSVFTGKHNDKKRKDISVSNSVEWHQFACC